jgi:hypothetical protein
MIIIIDGNEYTTNKVPPKEFFRLIRMTHKMEPRLARLKGPFVFTRLSPVEQAEAKYNARCQRGHEERRRRKMRSHRQALRRRYEIRDNKRK